MVALDGERGRGSGRSIDALRPARRPDAPARSTCAASAATARPPGLEIERERVDAFAAALARARRATCSSAGGPRAGRARRRGRRRRRARHGARRGAAGAGARSAAATRRVSLMLADATLRRRAADGRRQARALHRRAPAARARARSAFGSGGRLPVAEGEPVAGDVHARGQRVERRQRAAPGAAPRPGRRAVEPPRRRSRAASAQSARGAGASAGAELAACCGWQLAFGSGQGGPLPFDHGRQRRTQSCPDHRGRPRGAPERRRASPGDAAPLAGSSG